MRVPCLAVLGLLALSAGCQAVAPSSRVRAENEGGLYVYLQPFGPEAERLTVVVQAVAALRSDGSHAPLSLSLRELRFRDTRRQRLLAAGPLPAGDYAGLAFMVASATLRGEEGSSALLVPEAPARIDVRFTVRRRESGILALALRYADAVEGGVRFVPAFAAYVPTRPPVGVQGFVANTGSNDITMFDKKTRHVAAVIATGREPAGMALDQRARRLYVALAGDDGIDVIDALAGTITDRIRLTPGDGPVDLALTRDGRILLSANRRSNSVSVVDAASRFEATRIPVGSGPRAIVLDPAGRRAFVLNTVSNTVSVIDIAARAVVRTIQTDPGPAQGRFNRRGDRLYVVHELTPYVTVINPMTLAVTGRFAVRSGADTIMVDPGTDLVYLAGRRELVVGVYEPLGFAVVDFLDTAGGIADMVADGEEDTLYLASPGRNRVLVSHRIRRGVAGEIDVGDGPSRMRLMGEM